MREIKFRGVNLYRTEDEPMLVYGQFEWDAWHHPRIINEHGAIEVESDTIGQYTGLKDKNGLIDIYEGDIIGVDGDIIGNKYEDGSLLQGKSNLVIEGFGTKDWLATYKKAMVRGCKDSE
jgi:hypothetical protein